MIWCSIKWVSSAVIMVLCQYTMWKWNKWQMTNGKKWGSLSELKAKVTMKLIMSCPLDVGLQLDCWSFISKLLHYIALHWLWFAQYTAVCITVYGCHMPHDLWNGITLLTLLTIGGQSQWRSCGWNIHWPGFGGLYDSGKSSTLPRKYLQNYTFWAESV